MAKPGGFMEHARQEPGHRPVEQRVADYLEIELPLPEEVLTSQAARCMDCGIPFCHGAGCPVHNRIPEVNDLVYRGRWQEASELLHSTNNFPEFTGRVCPALCEAACSLAINDQPVLVKHIEYQIVERAFAAGWIQPQPAVAKSGRRVAIVGSGPAGLAAAQQLARVGHDVTVFEKDDRIGGLLRYGIPDFKLEKRILDRRLEQLRAEGVGFEPGVHVGKDISPRYLRRTFDAVCLTMGAGWPRDLDVPGRQASNVHFALDYLTQQNRINAGDKIDLCEGGPGSLPASEKTGAGDGPAHGPPGAGDGPAHGPSGDGPAGRIDAAGKVVVVLGGGDTGSDCVGTARRQGARQIHLLEILPQPPATRPAQTPWPMWPQIMRTSSSHEEGCERRWGVLTKKLVGQNGLINELHGIQVAWATGPGGMEFKEVPGTEFVLPADLVLIAMGFMHVAAAGLIEEFGLARDRRGNLAVTDWMTSEPGIFAAGDAVSGASLVVRAIDSGRKAAEAIDRWLET